MDSSRAKLTPLQQLTLRAFFAEERGFFLTGGAALAGFHLGHRATSDLDLFTLDASAFERGRHALARVAESLEATLVVRQDAPGFKRFVLTQNGDAVVVDLVLERVVQRVAKKLEIDGIIVDPPQEIVSNKLNTIVSRMEERDLVDLYCLERAGYDVESALPSAEAKDGGCTPATLAWILSEIRIPDDTKLPGDVTPAELRDYVESLLLRLRRRAFPSPE